MPLFLDEPFSLELARLEEARMVLRSLASQPGPLPPYWRSALARLALQVTRLRRELRQYAQHVELEPPHA